MTDNPTYDQILTSPLKGVSQGEQQKIPMSDSTINKICAMPTEQVATIDTSPNSRSHCSTIRHIQSQVYGGPSYPTLLVQNPVYGVLSTKNVDGSGNDAELTVAVVTSPNPVYEIGNVHPISLVQNPVYGALSDKISENELSSKHIYHPNEY